MAFIVPYNVKMQQEQGYSAIGACFSVLIFATSSSGLSVSDSLRTASSIDPILAIMYYHIDIYPIVYIIKVYKKKGDPTTGLLVVLC